MLQAQQLTKHLGGRTLFAALNWQIQPGARIGLVGPNGAGKTTLLNIINGLDVADGGTVTLGGDETLGFLPQEAPRHDGGSVLDRVLSGAVEVRALQARLAAVEAAMTAGDAASATAAAAEYSELLERLELLGGLTLEARAKEILAGLGFATAALDGPLARLSGGWWMRVELARILLLAPSYLFLDEPTNHLDLTSMRWLESFLAQYRGAWVVVSHDRYFLNRMVEAICELSADGLLTYPGTYDDYVEARAELDAQLAKQAKADARRRATIERFVERFRYTASKARQVQSRVKALERRGAAPGARRRGRTLQFALPQPARAGEVVFKVTGLRKAFGARVIYDGLDLQLRRGDKLALVGDNGAGKSTLLKMLAGTLAPDAGTVALGHAVTPYYFAQHQLETLDPARTVLEEMQTSMPAEGIARVRGVLGAFLFGADAVDRQVGVLSGGEKGRLALAKMLARPANLLLLDEPTNHLDLASRDMLERALLAYEGSIVFISHDRYFINSLATRVMEVRPGSEVRLYDGDYDYYQWKLAEAQVAEPERVAPATQAAPRAPPAPARTQGGAKRRARAQASIEAEIDAAEARVRAIDTLMCDPEVYADAARCRDLLAEREQLESRTASLYAEWQD